VATSSLSVVGAGFWLRDYIDFAPEARDSLIGPQGPAIERDDQADSAFIDTEVTCPAF
jgi:hypothetical protein